MRALRIVMSCTVCDVQRLQVGMEIHIYASLVISEEQPCVPACVLV